MFLDLFKGVDNKMLSNEVVQYCIVITYNLRPESTVLNFENDKLYFRSYILNDKSQSAEEYI